jgi:hypothetical protein
MYRCIEFAGFAIILDIRGYRERAVQALQDAFFRGVFSHDYGGRIWRDCSDQGW